MPEERATGVAYYPLRGGADVRRRAENVQRVALFVAAIAGFAVVLYFVTFLRFRAWQALATAGLALVSVLLSLAARRLAYRRRVDQAAYLMLGLTVLVLPAVVVFTSGLAVPVALGALLFSILLGVLVLPRRRIVWAAMAGIAGAGLAYAVDRAATWLRFDIARSGLLSVLAVGVIVVAVLIAVWQLVRAARVGTIRTRLLISFVLMVLLSAIAISGSAVLVSYNNGRQQAVGRLEAVVRFKGDDVDDWVTRMEDELASMLAEVPREGVASIQPYGDDLVLYGRALLTVAPGNEVDRISFTSSLRPLMQQAVIRSSQFDNLYLLTLEGEVIIADDPLFDGIDLADRPYFKYGLVGPYVHRPVKDSLAEGGSIFASRPLRSADGNEVYGVLVGRASLASLLEVATGRTGLTGSGRAYLVDSDYVLLDGGQEQPVYVESEGAHAALEGHQTGSGLYTNYEGIPVVGAYRWLPQLKVALLAEQNLGEALRATYVTLGINVAVAAAAVLVAVVAALRVTRSIADPLADLAETASQIAAGDLERTARVEREDETGALARAFNSMTVQLKNTIGTLEQRVADRTRYLQAAAEVGRVAGSILDMEQLTRQVADLIRERFNLYYVGLFLVDEAGEWAVLRAGTGEAGRAMLARGHRIRVGEGMIGWSVATGQARVALEAGEDAIRLATEELPDTRSEAALPLRSRGRVLGALTVQSDRPGAFDEAALAVLQTMADQVAVALDNARLFTESQEALGAVRRAYGEFSGEAWRELLTTRPRIGFRSGEEGVTSAGEVWRPEMEQALRLGRTVRGDGSGYGGRRFLAVPIKVRGEVIGVLDTYKPAAGGDWMSEEVTLLEEVAERLGVALDGARLYLDTQSRAARERLVGEITSRMRETLDLDAVLQAAVREIGERLGIAEVEVRMGMPESVDDRE